MLNIKRLLKISFKSELSVKQEKNHKILNALHNPSIYLFFFIYFLLQILFGIKLVQKIKLFKKK